MMNSKHILRWFSITSVWLWLILFALVPALLVILTSFLHYDANELVRWQLTWHNYQRLFDAQYLLVFWRSFLLASVCTGLCLIIAYPFAYFLARLHQGKYLLLLLIMIPFWTSSLIRTYAIVAILKAKGVLNTLLIYSGLIEKPLSILYSTPAVLIGLVYSLLPFMILPLYASIEKLDRRLIDAARDLGANRIRIFWHVMLPLTLPGIMGGLLLVLLPAMSLFYIPDILGGARSLLIGNAIADQFLSAHNWPVGSAVSMLLSALMILMLLLYFKINKTQTLLQSDDLNL